ncbi:hypothetical protein KFU94_06280 [Chloroflexi bacterium TSY]|nr:hypothetical protein [Chloroflexi bacterium TSY]
MTGQILNDLGQPVAETQASVTIEPSMTINSESLDNSKTGWKLIIPEQTNDLTNVNIQFSVPSQ